MEGVSDDEFLILTNGEWRSRAEGGGGVPLDSLSPAVRDSVLHAHGLDEDGHPAP